MHFIDLEVDAPVAVGVFVRSDEGLVQYDGFQCHEIERRRVHRGIAVAVVASDKEGERRAFRNDRTTEAAVEGALLIGRAERREWIARIQALVVEVGAESA